MNLDNEVLEIGSKFQEIKKLLENQLEIQENKAVQNMLNEIQNMKLEEYDELLERIELNLEAKFYLLKRFKLMLDIRFLAIGIEYRIENEFDYFSKSFGVLKNIETEYHMNIELVLKLYGSYFLSKLTTLQNTQDLDQWMTVIKRLQNDFGFDIQYLVQWGECCYSELLSTLIQNKDFEAKDQNSVEICDLIAWVHSKIHDDHLDLSSKKNQLIDAALDYTTDLNNQEAFRGKSDRVYLNRVFRIIKTIETFGLEEQLNCESIKLKLIQIKSFFSSVQEEEPEKIELIKSKEFFEYLHIKECLEVDDDLRIGWKQSTTNNCRYFVKFYIENTRKIEEVIELESEVYSFLYKSRSIFVKYYGTYRDQLNGHFEYGLIIEHSEKTLRTEIEEQKKLGKPFSSKYINRLLLSVITILDHLYSVPLETDKKVKRLFHLDICPENIILTKEGYWKLTGFNTFFMLPNLLTDNYLGNLKKDYMAPELIESCLSLKFKFIPSKADVYSLGVVIEEVVKLNQGNSEFFEELSINCRKNPENRPSFGEMKNLILINMDPISKTAISLDDFEIIRLLGKGQYGKVLLVQKKDTKSLFAMKILKKKLIQEKNQVIHTFSERSVLQKARHPNIVQLHYAFHNTKNLYMVLEYCPGGELYFHLSKLRRLPEACSKFYAACIILALNYLHSQKILYRDLKPENIVIDSEGYPKLTDFGLCKENMSKTDLTRTVCGTPEYIAPEIILRSGHGLAVDWWSLGCIIYEMLVGLPPFYVENRQEVYKKIVQQRVSIPPGVNPEAADLITKLLIKDQRMRLGAGGGEDVMNHRWFSDIKWDLIEQKKIRPPFVPRLNNPGDPTYICEEFMQMSVGESSGMGSPQGFSQTFKGFSYNGSNDSGRLEIDI